MTNVYMTREMLCYYVRASLELTESPGRLDQKENKVLQESFKRATKVKLEKQAQTETLEPLVTRSVIISLQKQIYPELSLASVFDTANL